MLKRLLAEIQAGGTLQTAALAKRLNTSPEMVQAMLADLERMGLLREVSAECGQSSCGGCPLVDGCGTSGRGNGRLWMLAPRS